MAKCLTKTPSIGSTIQRLGESFADWFATEYNSATYDQSVDKLQGLIDKNASWRAKPGYENLPPHVLDALAKADNPLGVIQKWFDWEELFSLNLEAAQIWQALLQCSENNQLAVRQSR